MLYRLQLVSFLFFFFIQIHIDIPRTNPLIPLFQQEVVQHVSFNINNLFLLFLGFKIKKILNLRYNGEKMIALIFSTTYIVIVWLLNKKKSSNLNHFFNLT